MSSPVYYGDIRGPADFCEHFGYEKMPGEILHAAVEVDHDRDSGRFYVLYREVSSGKLFVTDDSYCLCCYAAREYWEPVPTSLPGERQRFLNYWTKIHRGNREWALGAIYDSPLWRFVWEFLQSIDPDTGGTGEST